MFSIVAVEPMCIQIISDNCIVPATTSEVPINESIAVENFGLRSPNAFDDNRHTHVAIPSTTAPYNIGTW